VSPNPVAIGGNASTGGSGGTGGGQAAGGATSAGGAPPVIPAFGKKNVLFIMADDMNDWVQPFGGHPQAKTPNIAKLAAKGLVFRNAYAPVPVCLPSRTAMLLGMRPHDSKQWGNMDVDFRDVPELKDRKTLPQFFKEQGYFSSRAGKIFHTPTNLHPDSWDTELPKGGTAVPSDYVSTHGMMLTGYAAEGMEWGYTKEDTAHTADFQSAEFIAAQLTQKQDKPFFFAYGAHKPHQPWFVPKKYFDLYPEGTIVEPVYKADDLDDIPSPIGGLDHLEFLRTGSTQKGLQAYLAALSFADECIGHVLDALEKSPHKDNTIIVFMGDHGWHLGEKGHWGKATLWEEATRTPLIIYDPSLGVAGETTEPVSLQDIYPTLVELNGLKVAPGVLAGQSLVPLLVNPNNPSHVGWALSSWSNGADALRTQRWSLIRHGKAGAYEYELYDMIADELQHTNLAKDAKHAELIRKLSEDIDNIIATNAPKNQAVYEL
jgi:arylsulfatase A-like enzyme